MHGDYPISMRTNAGARVPTFTNRESEQVKGSYDFIGVIHYNNVNVTDNPNALKRKLRDHDADMAAELICTYFVTLKDNGFSKRLELFHAVLIAFASFSLSFRNFKLFKLSHHLALDPPIIFITLQTCLSLIP